MRIQLIYPGPTHSTFDVAEGYRRALERIEGVTLTSFPYHNNVRFYQESLKHWATLGLSSYEYDEIHAFEFAAERAILQAVDFRPDVALVVAGAAYHRRGFELFKNLGVPAVLMLTECPYNDDLHTEIIKGSYAVAATVNDLMSVETASRDGGVSAAYLPHSYDPPRHHPDGGPTDGPSVFFHGTLWDERKRLLSGLRDIPGAHIGGITPTSRDNVISNAEMAEFYRRSKVCVNNHRIERGPGRVIEEGAAYSLGPRAFEIAACGGFQICDYRAELVEVFGDSVPIYEGARQLRDLVLYYLEHEAEREELRKRQHEAVADCTFENRARVILLPFITEVLKDGRRTTNPQ